MRIVLPCEVAQIDPRIIEAVVEVYNGPLIHSDAIDTIAAGMSDVEKDKLIDDVADFMQAEAFKRRIVIQ